MIKTYSQMDSQQSSIIRLVWRNGCVFVFDLSDCGFESHWSHFNFRYRSCFEYKDFLDIQIYSDTFNYRVLIHSKMRMWNDKSIQSNAPYRQAVTTQFNNLASPAKWLSVRLRSKWLWVRIPLKSLKLQVSHLFQARSSLTFRKL